MSGKQEGVKETAQQKALAEVAMKQLGDYRKRWSPLQSQLAEQITSAGAPDSQERRKAAGKASTDNAVQFGSAQDKITDTLASRTGLGSSRTKLAIASGGDDQATSRGLGLAGADQAIDDAYMQGLGALTAIGRGERAGAVQGMSQIADASGRQAQADAASSLGRRMGNAQLVGQVAGFGLAGGFKTQSPNIMQNIPADAGDFGGLSNIPMTNQPGGR
jgi:hypothetical protein